MIIPRNVIDGQRIYYDRSTKLVWVLQWFIDEDDRGGVATAEERKVDDVQCIPGKLSG